MRDKVREILEREVNRLREQSEHGGLALDDLRSLDLLIKAHKTFVSTGDEKPEDSATDASTEALLADLRSSDD
jgi:hypothetical protein